MNGLQPFFLLTDLGFLLYWSLTALKLIPLEWAYSDYTNPILVAWNWSFFPLDMLISATGLYAVYRFRQRQYWQVWALVSLVLTIPAGLNAVGFWALRAEFDPAWWIPNLYLVIYPLFFIPRLMGSGSRLVNLKP